MSFRNDHDAALLRVDALESELETLRLAYERDRDREQEPTPAPRSSGLLAGILVATAMVAGALGVTYAVLSHDDAPPLPAIVADEPEAMPLDELRACRAAIAHLEDRLDATTTDPATVQARPVRPILATGAGCRSLLAEASTSLALDPRVRRQLAEWSRAEDDLAGAITRTVIYYESDPHALDHYISAPQLWREYDRAITARDAVLARFAPEL